GPVRGVEARAGKALETGQVGDVGLGRESGAENEESRPAPVAVRALDLPLVRLGVEPCGGNPGVEPNVAGQVELGVDVAEIAPQLVPGREALGPVPVAPELFHRELVIRDMRIDA